MECTVFFSWQTDLPNKTNRSLIRQSIDIAIKNLSEKSLKGIKFLYDESTYGEVGAPDIGETIINKISKSDIFICDISIINHNSKFRKSPNPNVMFELGYAASCLGWDNIICIYDTAGGKIDQLPFDINHRRILPYSSTNADAKKILALSIQNAIERMISKGLLYSPLKDHLKGKMDYCFLSILKQLCCIIFGTVTMSDARSKVNDLLRLSQLEICQKLVDGHQILGFFTENNLMDIRDKLDTIFVSITTSTVFPQQWSLTVLKLIDWLRSYQWYISSRSQIPLSSKAKLSIGSFDIVKGSDLNPNNPSNIYLLVKNAGATCGQVLYSATMSRIDRHVLLTMQNIIPENAEKYGECFYRLINITDEWLSSVGDEFILDPDYYEIT